MNTDTRTGATSSYKGKFSSKEAVELASYLVLYSSIHSPVSIYLKPAWRSFALVAKFLWDCLMPRLLMLYKICFAAFIGRHGGTEIERLVVKLRLNFTRTGGTVTRASIRLSEYLHAHPLNN